LSRILDAIEAVLALLLAIVGIVTVIGTAVAVSQGFFFVIPFGIIISGVSAFVASTALGTILEGYRD
jgi:hypothetical protein